MKDKNKHSKHYYEINRNMSATSDALNTKMPLNKKDLGLRDDNRVPDYYKGKNGYEARKVCDNFDLTYHLAT